MNRIKNAMTVLLLATLLLPVVAVHANIPTVLAITRRTDSNNNILVDVKVNHASPSDTHYISQIALDLDGTIRTFTDLPKATTVEATYTLNIRTNSPKVIKAQATCIIHGPGGWVTEATSGTPGGTTGGGVPAYPVEATIAGTLVAIAVILMIRKK
jgi:desulfoferrodoxin (superoxide reductase-like protein)